MILPPDDSNGTPFFADPAAQPGFHRDLFKTWGRRIAAELLMLDYPMSPLVRSHLPTAYQSESEDEVVTPRSCSPAASIDSSDMEGAHRPPSPDSSDVVGAHHPLSPDSSEGG